MRFKKSKLIKYIHRCKRQIFQLYSQSITSEVNDYMDSAFECEIYTQFKMIMTFLEGQFIEMYWSMLLSLADDYTDATFVSLQLICESK